MSHTNADGYYIAENGQPVFIIPVPAPDNPLAPPVFEPAITEPEPKRKQHKPSEHKAIKPSEDK